MSDHDRIAWLFVLVAMITLVLVLLIVALDIGIFP